MRQATEASQGTLAHGLNINPGSRGFIDYLTVLKPRETVLLAFIGICSAIIGGEGSVSARVFVLAFFAITLGSAGANALTNYLDREVDARMKRTHMRALPSKRIASANRALIWSLSLIIIGLVFAWYLHPLCFVFGLAGTVAASVFRKKFICVIQGGIAGCAPVLIGYVAVTHQLDWTIFYLCVLIAVWIPLHVWSVMVANREDYLQAGVIYFPVTWKSENAIKVLMILSVMLYAASIALWHAGGFGWLYFAAANIMGIIMVYAGFNLIRSGTTRDAWKVYKLTAFPYLGVIFIVLCLNFWI